MEWYNKSESQIFEELQTSKEGLSSAEAAARLDKYGTNELAREAKTPFIKKVIAQIIDPMILILIGASIVSAVMGEVVDAVIIIAIVIVNTILSLYQEGKAEQAIEALQKMSSPKASVIRDGKQMQLDSTQLVPGDYVVLETGDIIPADMRLIESANLKIDESSLTGESVPVEKDGTRTYDGVMEIGDRENYAYSSTIVAYGRGAGVVTTTGGETEIGRIAKSISATDNEQTPLQKRLANLSKLLGMLVIIICILVLVVGMLRGHEFVEMFMTAISLAVAAVPEGLPAIVTIVLSLGMGKMAERNAIVKKLLAVETLGTTTVICSDKTGTLTQNEMTVTKVYADGKVYNVTGTGYKPEGDIEEQDAGKVDVTTIGALERLTHVAGLTNDAKLTEDDGEWGILGDPTEGALLTLAEKAGFGIKDLNQNYNRVNELPFDSDRKMMTTFHDGYTESSVVSFTKGAPDIVLSKCNRILQDGKEVPLTDELKDNVMHYNSLFAQDALRVLSFAYREWDSVPDELDTEHVENDMVFIGLTGMIDPARPEAKVAIAECKTAGITPIMITGDHLETGYAIAKELGIATDVSQAIMGRELNALSAEELREVVKEKRVYTRVSPENKVQIVTALKELGHIAAMTGDGVNDAPAIKRADIGIAMGITGTDVAKNTAEVILTDDNFATIVNAVEEGRAIYSNIKKFVAYLLSCNLGEVFIIFIAILMGIPVPLLPIQLLWLNLVSDSFPALALGVEKGDADVMTEPPRDPEEPLLDNEIKLTVAIQSIAITVATLGAYYIGLHWFGNDGVGLTQARTMAFTTLVWAELLRAFSARSIKDTVFTIGLFTNTRLVQAFLVSFGLVLVVLVIEPLRDIFKLHTLPMTAWGVVVVAALIPLVLGELQKLIRFNKTHHHTADPDASFDLRHNK
ncbi:cation-translocating P-type ATPase [Peptoniphilus equinus]|uniref:Cation-translocating P-type ATPase n=1 Tax=Peptoniphilus equinus TaxID=3016343 RepID=A0ABY7QVQ3_9FIRM|nr:cation-translocating P-type ATPase [Peptoniphilus equinus]WBW50501.1 cation-translocating P-type ATPase [Peptoniphilus equinus]